MTVNLMTTVVALSTIAMGLTAAGAVALRESPPALRRAIGGPYRTKTLDAALPPVVSGTRLVAVGSALLACTTGPALIVALASLRWEGIGVTLFPALLLVAARLYASVATFRQGDLAAARIIGHASLLLDVPLLVFSLVHMKLIEGDSSHESLSLAAVAGAFAVADGLQAALVLAASSRARQS